MRQKKTHPKHVKTRLYSEIEKALRSGGNDIIFSFALDGTRRRRLVAMHLLGDRVLFFDPELNPEMSYSADLGRAGTPAEGFPGYRYEGNGLHSLERTYLKNLFLADRAYALVPLAYKLAV